ncbi:MAG: DUF389 domain-containing protein [Bacteroidota bacterium]
MATENQAPGNTSPPKPEEKIQRGFSDLWSGIREFFHDLIDLREGLDKEGTIINIKNNKRMRGANAWLLMCSIMIASLGLTLNSPAVIIGAMLISPLMSPILGIGLGVGINDRKTLYISLKHFGISIAIALITSTIYFLFTPINELTSEISARTKPTLLDAFVAFFGGIAGIISGSRKDQSNAIPGVAIATALMPPLCVTGFGIANLIRSDSISTSNSALGIINNWEIIFNSFYLFFLNAVLVSLATFLIVRLLNFPVKAIENPSERIRNQLLILLVTLVLIVPSVTILIGVLGGIEEDRNIRTALRSCFGEELKPIDSWKKIPAEDGYGLLVKVYGPSMTRSVDEYAILLEEKLPNANVEIIPTSEIDLSKFETIEARVDNIEKMDSLFNAIIEQPKSEQEIEIERLSEQISILQSDTLLERAVEQEIKAMYGDLFKNIEYNRPKTKEKLPKLYLYWKPGKASNRQKALIKDRLVPYVMTRTRDTVELGYVSQ